VNQIILKEVLDILAGPADILKNIDGIYFFKVGLFKEWLIRKEGLTFAKILDEFKHQSES